MPLHAPILKDVDAAPPGGCSSRFSRDLFVSFFRSRHKGNQYQIHASFRDFARYSNKHESAWPQLLEELLRLDQEHARARVQEYKKWRPDYGRSKYYATTGIPSFFRFAYSKGIIPWNFTYFQRQDPEHFWKQVSPEYRMVVEEWLKWHKLRGLAPATIEHRCEYSRPLGEWLARRGTSFQEVDSSIALDFAEHVLKHSEWSTSYKAAQIQGAKVFYRWLKIRKRVSENPFQDLPPIRVEHKLPKVLTEAEASNLLNQTRKTLERVFLEFLYATGCRVGEACRLNIGSVSLAQRTAKVLGKGGRERYVLFNHASLKAIKAYLPIRERISVKNDTAENQAFFLSSHGNRLTDMTARAWVNRAGIRAGILGSVGPHTLRHTFATHLLNRGADLYTIMQLMGHRRIESTLLYLRGATKRLDDVYRKCHPRR